MPRIGKDIQEREFAMSENGHDLIKLPIEYKRIPRNKEFLCRLGLNGNEFGHGASDLYLVHPNKTREFWSLWIVNYDLTEKFVNQRFSAIPVSFVASSDSDTPKDTAEFLFETTICDNELFFGVFSVSSVKSGLLDRGNILTKLLKSKCGISEFFEYEKNDELLK
jgi:hypothetical protein